MIRDVIWPLLLKAGGPGRIISSLEKHAMLNRGRARLAIRCIQAFVADVASDHTDLETFAINNHENIKKLHSYISKLPTAGKPEVQLCLEGLKVVIDYGEKVKRID